MKNTPVLVAGFGLLTLISLGTSIAYDTVGYRVPGYSPIEIHLGTLIIASATAILFAIDENRR
jgi:hypothetical protein